MKSNIRIFLQSGSSKLKNSDRERFKAKPSVGWIVTEKVTETIRHFARHFANQARKSDELQPDTTLR